MNFFEKQDAARKKTSLLIFYFFVCVLLIIFSVYFVADIFSMYINSKTQAGFQLWQPELFVGVTLATIIIVTLGSLYKISVLSKGGKFIASSLGGRMVDPATTDLKERKLLNVVEEMSIASGIPVPPVYILDNEHGINAFAAGHTPGTAVVAVTRGTLDLLSRDEMQGVIAHEFSHIFNGDMRMNIRLMGVLYGILILAIIGRILLRTKGKKNPLPLLGLGLIVIGYIGVLFGRLIKAAVSRQREYLSDACAVQFTRNPDGIGGALKKIGALEYGSRITHSRAEEVSHFYFANGVRKSITGLMATHPSLVERIKRIDPSFDGVFPKIVAAETEMPERAAGLAAASKSVKISVDPEELVERIGNVQSKNLRFAASLLAILPESLKESVRKPRDARAVIYSLLLSGESKVEKSQLDSLRRSAGEDVYNETVKFSSMIKSTGPEARLPLIDMSMPALRNLSKDDYAKFKINVATLVTADQKKDLFEFILEKIIFGRLDPWFTDVKPKQPKYGNLGQMQAELRTLLSALAGVGNKDKKGAEDAFKKGVQKLGLGESLQMISGEGVDLTSLDAALDKLNLAEPKLKQGIIEAAVVCVTADEKITVEESELLRAIADSLECPIPPMSASN